MKWMVVLIAAWMLAYALVEPFWEDWRDPQWSEWRSCGPNYPEGCRMRVGRLRYPALIRPALPNDPSVLR